MPIVWKNPGDTRLTLISGSSPGRSGGVPVTWTLVAHHEPEKGGTALIAAALTPGRART